MPDENGMDFQEEKTQDCNNLANARNKTVSGISQINDGGPSLKNLLNAKTEDELIALYPVRGAKAILVKEFINDPDKGTKLFILVNELNGLLT